MEPGGAKGFRGAEGERSNAGVTEGLHAFQVLDEAVLLGHPLGSEGEGDGHGHQQPLRNLCAARSTHFDKNTKC